MGRRKELRLPRNVMFVAESEKYEKVKKVLGGKTFGEAVREWMDSVVDEYQNMEGLIPLDSQYSLDDFSKIDVESVKTLINSTEDRAILNHVRQIGEHMVLMSRTKLRKLNKELQI